MITEVLVVMVGCAFGGASRFLVSTAMSRYAAVFPYGTLIVNLVGCLLIGFISTLLAERYMSASPYVRLLLTVGFLGGLTTFSSFGYETLSLLRVNNIFGALANVGINVCGGLFLAWLGMVCARLLSR